MMVEFADGKFNFDIKSPPVNPITAKPITCWYKPGQTWTGEFGDLATTVDECRAELVGAYLMDNPELLEMLGSTEAPEIRAADCKLCSRLGKIRMSNTELTVTYNLHQQLGVDGLRRLSNFNVDSGVSVYLSPNKEKMFPNLPQKWRQAHSRVSIANHTGLYDRELVLISRRAHFTMLKCLLRDGSGVIAISHDKANNHLTVRVDRSRILTYGKPAVGKMLLHLHLFRCTADA